MADEAGPMPDAAASTSRRIAHTSRGSAAYPRKRAVAACQVCRARRTKCDQKWPSCSFCTKTGAVCVRDPSHLSTFDPASLEIIKRLERLERKIDLAAADASLPCSHPVALVALRDEAGGICDPDASTHPPSARLKPRFPVNLDSVLAWPVFQDRYFVSAHTPGVLSRGSLPLGTSTTTADCLDPSQCAGWLDAFFSHVHVKNPILDEAATRRLVRNVCLDGAGWDHASCLALLVCANGALASPLGSPSLTRDELLGSAAMALFSAAQKRLGPVLVTTGIIQAQCAFLTGIFLMSILKPVEAWQMFLHALNVCHSFGAIRQLNDCDTEGDSPAGHFPDIAAQESLYWSCWKSEQELRRELGAPYQGSCPTPDPPHLFPSPPDGCQGETLRAWYFYLSEISLWRLETEARQEPGRLAQDDAGGVLVDELSDMSHNISEQVVSWRQSLAPLVSIADHEPPEADDDVIRLVLRGRTTYMHELITWPFVHAVVNEGNTSPIVLSWAEKGLAFHVERLVINRPAIHYRHHGTWLMMRSSARSAFVLLAFASNASVASLMPPDWRAAVEATVDMLHYWSDEAEGIRPVAELMQQLLVLV